MKKKIYEAPQTEILEVYSEGVLCLSGENAEGSIEFWEEEEVEW